MQSLSFTLAIAAVTAVRLEEFLTDQVFAPIDAEQYMEERDLSEFADLAMDELANLETEVLSEANATEEALRALIDYHNQMGETNNALEAFGIKIEQMRGNFDEEIKVWWGNDYPESDVPAQVVPEGDVPAEVVPEDNVPAEVVPEDDGSEVPLTEEEIAEAESAELTSAQNAINPAEVVPEVEALGLCTKELNPDEEDRTYSSVWNNSELGRKSMLDSSVGYGAWISASNNQDQWIVLDASKEESIGGVVLQGRDGKDGHNDQIVTEVKLAYSTDNTNWIEVKSGQVLETGVEVDDGSGARYEVSFDERVIARYVKIMPQAWERHISLRAGLLLDGPEYC